MYAKTFGETVCGINGEEIIVEVDISNGLPGFDIVGLPDMAVIRRSVSYKKLII